MMMHPSSSPPSSLPVVATGGEGPSSVSCAAQAAAAHSAHYYQHQNQQQQQQQLPTSFAHQSSSLSSSWQPPQPQAGDGSSIKSDLRRQDRVDARPILPLAAFFMGDLRDGLPMVSRIILFVCLKDNQSIFLLISNSSSATIII